ncbi:secretion system protein [Frankia sp. B2]|nr:Flp pilus assembly protein TadB [Frankia sp. BMG5.23]KEZ37968.1 Flp pilus assembly protein TadB [Frankia sp. CeD]TFE32618.1 secretion system protein [Frankia sp. B2]
MTVLERVGTVPATIAVTRPRTGTMIGSGIGLVLGAVLLTLASGPVAAGVMAVLLCCLARARRRSLERRRQVAVRQSAEDLLAAFAAELDAGAPQLEALRRAAGGIDELVAAPAGRSAWLPIDQLGAALDRTEEPGALLCRSEASSLRQLGVAYQVCAAVGARLAPVATMLAAVARADAVRAGELTSALAGPRSSGRLVASLPLAGIVLGSLAGAAPIAVLLGTPAGIGCLLVGGLADLVGVRWLRRLADGVERRGEPVAVDATGLAPPTSAVAGHNRFLADFPLALDLIAACLRSGETIMSAARAVGAATGGVLGAELCSVGDALAAGATVGAACERLVAASHAPRLTDRLPGWARRGRVTPPSRRARMVRAAIMALDRAEMSGAKLAATLTRLADRARDEAHAESIAAARRAGVLAVAPLGLCFLPAFLLLGVVPMVLGSVPALLPA